MKTITINVSEPVYRDFQRFASAQDRSTSEIIRQAMEEFRDRKIRPARSVAESAPYYAGKVSGSWWPGDLSDEMLFNARD